MGECSGAVELAATATKKFDRNNPDNDRTGNSYPLRADTTEFIGEPTTSGTQSALGQCRGGGLFLQFGQRSNEVRPRRNHLGLDRRKTGWMLGLLG
jgi:hypothetical protein